MCSVTESDFLFGCQGQHGQFWGMTRGLGSVSLELKGGGGAAIVRPAHVRTHTHTHCMPQLYFFSNQPLQNHHWVAVV